MTSRRTVVAGLATTALTATTGCIGFLTGQEALTFAAEPAAVEASAAENAGYSSDGPRTESVERSFTVAGQERQVVAENEINTYEKSLDLGFFEAKLGVFTVISTPAVEIAGQTLNPIGDYSNQQLVNLVQSQYEGLSDVREVSTQTITAQGTQTEVTKYAAKATVSGQQVDVYIHVTKYRDGEDFIVAVGVYPQQLGGEEENVLSMMRAIQHPV
ncbi:DUF6517 family protein [Halogeometricum limi]|uniref:Uncharacterized protein n=1 Tax=Halogeometricum limi TaxID=555875 RepID=A0A1I6IQZ0_9EURY|nr:DUF6517 family protein [Halogeometricum limi]SFR69175.1 hypothetical protein SAMN04488124_3547 [Halogeometricum limi]